MRSVSEVDYLTLQQSYERKRQQGEKLRKVLIAGRKLSDNDVQDCTPTRAKMSEIWDVGSDYVKERDARMRKHAWKRRKY